MPVQQIEASLIRYIKNMQQSDDLMDFKNKFGHTSDAKISDVLWLCTTMFTNARKVIKSRNIIWFTDEDSPNVSGQSQAFQKAKDLQQLQIEVVFCPLISEFDGEKFYRELVCQIMKIDLDEFEFPEPMLDEKHLLGPMTRRGHKNRAMAYLEFEISSALKFGVGVYSNKRKDKAILSTVQLLRKDNSEIKRKRFTKFAYKRSSEDAGSDDEEGELDYEHLNPADAYKFLDIGDEKVKFTTLEAFEIKQVMNPKLKLLAFKPKSFVNECYYFIKSQSFLYPHDGRIKNSSKLFRALWEKMIADDKVAVCAYTMRMKSFPRLVILVPSQQALQDGELFSYDGFHLIYMPYADDIRDLSKFMPEPVAEQENDFAVRENLSKIISKLRIKYTPTMFDNMRNHRIIACVESQAYDEELDDDTRESFKCPNIEAQDERIGQYVDIIDSLIDGFEEVKVTKRKKETTTDVNANTEKRTKVAPEDLNKDLILEKCLSGDVKSVTVQQLKDYLSSEKVSGISKLNKTDLAAKIVALKKN